MNIETLKAEVKQAVMAIEALAVNHGTNANPIPFMDWHNHVGINFSLEALEIAQKMTGADSFFCKMLNYKFRNDAAELMFEHALIEVGNA